MRVLEGRLSAKIGAARAPWPRKRALEFGDHSEAAALGVARRGFPIPPRRPQSASRRAPRFGRKLNQMRVVSAPARQNRLVGALA